MFCLSGIALEKCRSINAFVLQYCFPSEMTQHLEEQLAQAVKRGAASQAISCESRSNALEISGIAHYMHRD